MIVSVLPAPIVLVPLPLTFKLLIVVLAPKLVVIVPV